MITVPVALGSRSYDVRIGAFTVEQAADGLAAALGQVTGIALLVDGRLREVSSRSAALEQAIAARMPGCKIARFDLPPGESCKTLSAIERTCDWLAAQGFDRGATVIGVGGGATSDHAGFVAAIYLRGMPFAICSTTLLGMVDASVGGKTGVDLQAGKNLVGAFHQPCAVVADLTFLETLPRREQAAGMAEVVKAGLIADAELFTMLERRVADGSVWSQQCLQEAIVAAVKMKARVVVADERENDLRAILNFGHTIGHAIESESAHGLLHGEAISLGMLAALELGIARGCTDPALLPRTTALLSALGLPVDLKARLAPPVLDRVDVDKKRRARGIRFVFVTRLGETRIEAISLADLRRQVLSPDHG